MKGWIVTESVLYFRHGFGSQQQRSEIAALDVRLGFEFPQGGKCGVRGLTRLSGYQFHI